MTRTVWCAVNYIPVSVCTGEHTHTEIVSQLGSDDEPQVNGALVAVWVGDYRLQKVWVASGANVGNWYCLGGEFGVPKVWIDPQPPSDYTFHRGLAPQCPPGQVPLHPRWEDVLARGPVSLLSADTGDSYREGWRNGRRALHQEIEALAEDDSGADDGRL